MESPDTFSDPYNAYLEEFTFLPSLEPDPLTVAASSSSNEPEPEPEPESLMVNHKIPAPIMTPHSHSGFPRANGLSDFLKKRHRIRNETERLRDFVEANDLRKARNRRISLSDQIQFVADVYL